MSVINQQSKTERIRNIQKYLKKCRNADEKKRKEEVDEGGGEAAMLVTGHVIITL